MSMTVCSEESGPGSADIEIPKTCETSSGIFTQTIRDDDMLTDHDRRNISCEERKRNQTVIDLTADDDDDPTTSAPTSEISDLPPLMSPVPPPTTLAQSTTPTPPPASSTSSVHDLAPSMPSEQRGIWSKTPPPWTEGRERILARMRRPEKLDAVRSPRRDCLPIQNNGEEDRVMEQRSALLSGDDGQARTGPSVRPSSGSCSSDGAGRVALGAIPPSPPESIGSVEIPETPSGTDQWCHTDPSVVRVMGKRLGAERPGYLVLCWVYSCEGEEANSKLDRHLREYDEKISRDRLRQERLSTLRRRKHSPTRESQDSNQTCKRAKTKATARVSSQNHTYPSRQVEEDLFLDADVCSLDLEPL